MKGFNGGMAQLMKQANQMQIKMKKVQEEIAKMEFEGSSGGGVVKVKVNGDHMLVSLTIAPDVMKEGDAEMLQDLILTAANDAMKVAKDKSAKEMEKVTGGINVPGLS